MRRRSDRARSSRDGLAGVTRVGRVVDLSERDAALRGDPAQSSYSGLNVGGRSPSQPSFPFTRPKGVSTSTAWRFSLCRLTGYRRMPRVVVSRKRISSIAGIFGSSQRTETITPGRFFFIWIGVTKASSAPASMSRVIV